MFLSVDATSHSQIFIQRTGDTQKVYVNTFTRKKSETFKYTIEDWLNKLYIHTMEY